MKRNPVMPYALIAVLGITLMIIIGFVGLNQMDQAEEGKEGEGEKTAQEGGSGDAGAANPEEIYSQTCAGCHGQDLSGQVGPNLQTIGSKLSKEDIKGIIQNGQGGMPAQNLNAEKTEAVAKWLSEKK
ncbi:cytochrome c550 [Pontibacillus salipaludis]|uniref:Cytochrome c n=1 Tax=Pontibacillus salipaludis TaxID=1697394 RepID=A0ABQ1PUT0_9BACI|nr:cytochrome c [Pontibacillus salipaludis]GGD04614.1 cytochrome c [Pontibacillus salipaludis]